MQFMQDTRKQEVVPVFLCSAVSVSPLIWTCRPSTASAQQSNGAEVVLTWQSFRNTLTTKCYFSISIEQQFSKQKWVCYSHGTSSTRVCLDSERVRCVSIYHFLLCGLVFVCIQRTLHAKVECQAPGIALDLLHGQQIRGLHSERTQVFSFLSFFHTNGISFIMGWRRIVA